MKNLWIKFGCFLTGYNYAIVKNSSEASAKAVKKYLSAILIVATLWGFIGFAFTKRYLHGDSLISIIGAAIMVILVIQIERQIILTVGKNNFAIAFRVAIGFVMAIIGSVILDQIIFKEDVDKNKIENIQVSVNNILPVKTQELTQQINQLDIAIGNKENERTAIIDEIGKKPTIYSPSSVVKYEKDTVTGRMTAVNQVVTNQSMPNPKAELIPQIDAQLKNLRDQKAIKENEKLNIQQLLEAELKSRVGFLDELKILFSILLSSGIALVVWSLLFLFFLSIELFVLVSKYGDSKNDYDTVILHQMELKMKMLDNLKKDTLSVRT